METIREHLVDEKADLDELPRKFEDLSRSLAFIHSKGAVVDPLNSDTAGYDSPEFSSLKHPLDFEYERRKNIVSLGKLMVGCYVSNETGFKDFSGVDTEWFKENEESIFNCFHYEDFDREYFKHLFEVNLDSDQDSENVLPDNYYYHVYLKHKKQAQRLRGATQNKGVAKALVSPHYKGDTEMEDSLDAAAKIHFTLSPLIIGLTIAIFAVIAIMIILIN